MVSAWAGIRPLVSVGKEDEFVIDEKVKEEKPKRPYLAKAKTIFQDKMRWLAYKLHRSGDSTASIARNHVIEVSESGLVSLMGGKWTSFRKMGEETVNRILKDNPQMFETKYDESQTLKF